MSLWIYASFDSTEKFFGRCHDLHYSPPIFLTLASPRSPLFLFLFSPGDAFSLQRTLKHFSSSQSSFIRYEKSYFEYQLH